jgi:sigma-E factor negative regulatory protein RseA
MNTNNMSREQISALADNELADSHIDVALAALRQPEQQATWDIYHQIGDVLRSDDMSIKMRPGFAARMAARLEAEPTIIAPAFSAPSASPHGMNSKGNGNKRLKRFALPGAIAAAAASVALVAGPQLMVATTETSGQDKTQVVASTKQPASHAAIISASAPQSATVSASASGAGTILRDPHIDEYLRAHQRFSPSVYSSAQFARSATLAHDSDK